MIQNYIKVALRNLAGHKTFSFINIFGLALSMSVCLLIIMLIKDAYTYDLFHPNSDRVYRIVTTAVRKDTRTERYASSPFILGKTLSEQCPQVEVWTPLISSFNARIQLEKDALGFTGLLTDGSFFRTFGFELEAGDPVTALDEPYSIVLTQELAAALFRTDNPVGKILTIPGYDSEFMVTGVLKPFPGKTHLEFTALGSVATQYAEEKLPGARLLSGEWRNYYSNYNFVRLQGTGDRKAAEGVLAHLAEVKYKGLELESRDRSYAFSLQPLNDITPGGMFSNSMGKGMPIFLLWFLSALGAVVILSSCFNYTNLTVARSLIRTKEIGVRKVLGASRSQVFIQILGEAILTALVSLVVAYFLLKFVKPQLARLSLSEAFDITIREDWKLYVLFIAFAAAIGLMAGLLPAFTLSKTKPVAVLQRLQNMKFMRRMGLRKVLLTLQFTTTLIFMITLTVVWKQTNHAIAVNFGFNQPQTLLVETRGVSFDKVSSRLSQVSGVEKISGISIAMGTWRDQADDVRTDLSSDKVAVREYFIDHHYLDHFEIPLVAGENFPENPSQQKEQFAIVNETFVRNFNLGETRDAIGKPLYVEDSIQLVIRGVTADFPFKPATYSIEPLLLRYDPSQLGVLNLTLNSQNTPATVAQLEHAWNSLETGRKFNASFFDETVLANFADAMDMIAIVGVFGILGMVIACMGLLGLSVYTSETRAKEISIRKVLGANVADVIILLSRGYLLIFVIGVCIAVPVSFLLGNQILSSFADRIAWSVLLFLPGIGLLFVAAAITMGSQTVKAALANPGESLKIE